MSRFDAAYVPSSAMTIFAHPDDAEFGVAATLARWSAAGCRVTMVLCTSGNVGTHDDSLTAATLAETRETEQRDAARLLGVRDLVFLRYDDCQLQPTLALRRDLVRVLRQYRPEVVLCNDPTPIFFEGRHINHPDHRAAGTAALEAVFPSAEMRLLWPDLGQPHKVSAVYVAWTEGATVWIDVADTLEAKIAALRAHASQMGDWDPGPMIREWAASDARTGLHKADAAKKAAAKAAKKGAKAARKATAKAAKKDAKAARKGGANATKAPVKDTRAARIADPLAAGTSSAADRRAEARQARAARKAAGREVKAARKAAGRDAKAALRVAAREVRPAPLLTESYRVMVLEREDAPPES